MQYEKNTKIKTHKHKEIYATDGDDMGRCLSPGNRKEAWNKCTAWCVTIINGRTTVYGNIINIEIT